MMKFFFRHQPPKNASSLLHLLPKTQPGIFSPGRWRFNKQWETVETIEDSEKREALYSQAYDNLIKWRNEATDSPSQTVKVLPRDWGVAALAATRQYGTILPVLNMASATYVGGAWHEGGSCQEENMFMRTTLPLEILRGMEKGYITYDESDKVFIYNETMNRVVDFEGYINTTYPQICFRGPDIHIPNDDFTQGPCSNSTFTSDPGLSFEFLPKQHIFPFYDFRFAALDLSHRNINLEDKSILTQYRIDLRQQTDALLDKLSDAGQTSAVLGGIGTGAYRHPASEVARSFKESLEERADKFSEIIFPLPIFTGETIQYDSFKEQLDGMKLSGPKALPPLPTREEFMQGADNPFSKEEVSLEQKPPLRS